MKTNMMVGEKVITGEWDGQPIWRKRTAGEVLAQSLVCQKCEGKGWVLVPNGEDDTDKEFCDCYMGTMLQEDEVKTEAWRLVAHND